MLLRYTADNRFIVVFAIAKRRSKRSGGRASADAGRKRRARFAEGRNRFVIITIFFFFLFSHPPLELCRPLGGFVYLFVLF